MDTITTPAGLHLPPDPNIPELQAPPDWHCIEFISDLHLQPSDPATFEAWRGYMAQTTASAVFILGDLFELWAGDDIAGLAGEGLTFEAQCLILLAQATRQRPVFFMHGNRDFLVGPAFSDRTQVTLLADPTVMCFGGARVLLSHGDALCLDDVDYQRFRGEVRTETWKIQFLSKPRPERLAIALHIRTVSEGKKQGLPGGYGSDLDATAVNDWLTQANASTLLHGHTHRPATHALEKGRQRVVLSDWDLTAQPPRAQVLRWNLEPTTSTHRAFPRFERVNFA